MAIKMRTNKKNKSKLISGIRSHSLLVGLVFASFSNVCSSNDLLSGTDLKDSSLSLSLTNKVSFTNANQQVSQLVLTQYGIYNETTVSQMADAGNTLNVLQNGMHNNANLSQVGSNNIINLEQLGNSNFAEVIQDGNANLANIKQTGEQTFTVHQIGSDMVVNITQY